MALSVGLGIAVLENLMFHFFPTSKVCLVLCGSNPFFFEYYKHCLDHHYSVILIENIQKHYKYLPEIFSRLRKYNIAFILFYSVRQSLTKAPHLVVSRNYTENTTNCPMSVFLAIEHQKKCKLQYSAKHISPEKYYPLIPIIPDKPPYVLNMYGSNRSEGSLYGLLSIVSDPQFCSTCF